jgi:hypothetical protein
MDFAEAERAFYELKGRLDTGKITPQEFQERLRDLTVRATDGRLWMIGGQTGRWYVFDGKNWLQAEPPRPQTAGRPAGCVRCGAPVMPGQALCERCDRALGAPTSAPPQPPPMAVRASTAAAGQAGRRGLVAAIAALAVVALCGGAVLAAILLPQSPLRGLLPGSLAAPSPTVTVVTPTAAASVTAAPAASVTATPTATAPVATAATSPSPAAAATASPTPTRPALTPTPSATATTAPATVTPSITPAPAATATATRPVPTPTATVAPPAAVSGRIAYTVYDPAGRTQNIYVINADGTGAQQIISQGMAPSWAPDGRVVYHSIRSDLLGLAIYYPDGSTKRPKQYEVLHEDEMPSWSPDASQLTFAFGSNAGGDKPWRIVVMNADGTGRYDLAGFNGRNPAWGPSNQIAFRRVYAQEGLYLVGPGGGVPRLLANVGNDTAPAWSPDGSRVAFMVDKDSKGDWDIYVVNADGSGLTNVTKSPGVVDVLPTWLPGSKYLAYRSNSGGVWGLWTMKADGTGASRIAQAELDTTRFMEDSMSAQ